MRLPAGCFAASTSDARSEVAQDPHSVRGRNFRSCPKCRFPKCGGRCRDNCCSEKSSPGFHGHSLTMLDFTIQEFDTKGQCHFHLRCDTPSQCLSSLAKEHTITGVNGQKKFLLECGQNSCASTAAWQSAGEATLFSRSNAERTHPWSER